jgi:lysophospholipase L1-like esterase
MKKVLIIGDSSAMPRTELPFDKTYYARLKCMKGLDIENSAVSNNTSYKILSKLDAFMLYGFNPEVVILNYGIVDVFPRPYSNTVYKVLNNLRLISLVDKVLKKNRLVLQVW